MKPTRPSVLRERDGWPCGFVDAGCPTTEIQMRRGVLQTLREAVQWIKAISAFEAMSLFDYFIIKLTPRFGLHRVGLCQRIKALVPDR